MQLAAMNKLPKRISKLSNWFDFAFFDNMLGALTAPAEIGTNMQQLRRTQDKIIDIEPDIKNDGMNTFDQAGIVVE